MYSFHTYTHTHTPFFFAVVYASPLTHSLTLPYAHARTAHTHTTVVIFLLFLFAVFVLPACCVSVLMAVLCCCSRPLSFSGMRSVRYAVCLRPLSSVCLSVCPVRCRCADYISRF